MDKCGGITTLFILWVIILSLGISSTIGDGGQNNAEANRGRPSAKDKLRDIYSQLTRSSASSWDKVKSFINHMQKEFFPPNLDFRSRDEVQSGSGGGDRGGGGSNEGARGRLKDAAEKSFGTSKVVVEESAKSAAKVVGEAVHKTAEKVKESMSDRDESDAEL